MGDGYGPEYYSGCTCIEDGCSEPAGTAWGECWRKACDIERKNRISEDLRRLIEGYIRYLQDGYTVSDEGSTHGHI